MSYFFPERNRHLDGVPKLQAGRRATAKQAGRGTHIGSNEFDIFCEVHDESEIVGAAVDRPGLPPIAPDPVPDHPSVPELSGQVQARHVRAEARAERLDKRAGRVGLQSPGGDAVEQCQVRGSGQAHTEQRTALEQLEERGYESHLSELSGI